MATSLPTIEELVGLSPAPVTDVPLLTGAEEQRALGSLSKEDQIKLLDEEHAYLLEVYGALSKQKNNLEVSEVK